MTSNFQTFLESRLTAYAVFTGRVQAIRQMMADPIWQFEQAKAIERLAEALAELESSLVASRAV
jgi:hypothetical protein